MSQALIQQADCCSPCPEVPITQIPGPAGEDGENGTNGTDGINAFTLTTAGFTMPNVEALVTVDVEDSTWMAVGQVIFVENAGYFRVDSLPDGTSVSLLNLGYTGNVAPATIVATAQAVSPGGLKGVDGTTPPTNTLNDLSPTTTKGDILVDNGTNNPDASLVRLSAGADGSTFVTDSSQPTGRKQVAITPNAATDNVLPRFDSSGDTTPTPLQASGLLVSDTGALQSTPTGGNARGASAIDLQVTRANATEVASGTNSVLAGGANNTASGGTAVVAGGNNNVASGSASGVVCGSGNSATGNSDVVGGGASNTASGGFSGVLSGTNNVASAQGATVCGQSNTASAQAASALGGVSNTVAGVASTVAGGNTNTISTDDYAVISGGSLNETLGTNLAKYSGIPGGLEAQANNYGAITHGSGKFSSVGDAQTTELLFRILTTTSTANVEMFLDGTALLATMWNFSSWAFHIITVARNLATDASAVWESKGGLKRSATPISLIGTVVQTLVANDGEGWMVNGAVLVDAGPSNNLRIRVTGALTTDIRWLSYVRLVQLGNY